MTDLQQISLMGKNKITWPDGKQFAFTIIDDTDNSFTDNIKPIYELLKECNILTTKTVWVYPSRDNFTGNCLQDEEYLEFTKNLIEKGYEIALHGVGSGSFTGDEIRAGIEEFKQLLGFYPKLHINHSRNPDNIYWGYKRFVPPLSWLMKLSKRRRSLYVGDKQGSPHFWGDISKKHIKYMRNHVFNGINTHKYDSQMPHRVKSKNNYSNYWFSSSDGHTLDEFNSLLTQKDVDLLEESGGFCIIYTHFAKEFLEVSGELNKRFEKSIRYLANKNGWFVPAGELLDYLLSKKNNDNFITYKYLARLDALWIWDRVIKRIKFGH
ncbi:hypothetical protein JYU16_00595 [bacterium AH-315-M05]|nr:hypothetical protein [bacterium AH-315-M05]